ncbi:hypothetical protein HK104_008873 [Borealophlyctis nickersoniae]|nr:hypothetical protein HK104_008873 [Borealophlyctis nickersoniae]
MQTPNYTLLHKNKSPVVLPSDIFPIIVRYCHPADARTIQRLNKEIASVVTTNSLVWAEARWRRSRGDWICWMWAAEKGHVDVVRWCLEWGAIDKYALVSAAGNGQLRVVKLLLDNDALLLDNPAEPDAHSGRALVRAAGGGHLDIVKLLLDQEVDFHQDHCGEALGVAVEGGLLDIVKVLVDKGAHIYHGDDIHHGDDALISAARAGHLDIVKLLLEKGVDVHAHSDEAFRWAARNDHLDVVRLLLENGANVHSHLDSAYRLARDSGRKEMVSLLMEYGAPIYRSSHQPTSVGFNETGDDQETPERPWLTWLQGAFKKFSPF